MVVHNLKLRVGLAIVLFCLFCKTGSAQSLHVSEQPKIQDFKNQMAKTMFVPFVKGHTEAASIKAFSICLKIKNGKLDTCITSAASKVEDFVKGNFRKLDASSLITLCENKGWKDVNIIIPVRFVIFPGNKILTPKDQKNLIEDVNREYSFYALDEWISNVVLFTPIVLSYSTGGDTTSLTIQVN